MQSLNLQWLGDLNRAPISSVADARGVARRLREAYKKDRAFTRFDALVQEWVTNPRRCAEMRLEAEAWIKTGEGSEISRLLLQVLAGAEPTAPELYRGDGGTESVWTLLQQFAPGSIFDFSLASFTSDRGRAEEFAWIRVQEGARTEVVSVLRAASRAVRIEVLAPDEVHWREREWYTGGRMLVEDSRVVAENRIEVTLTQEAVYHV